MFQNDYELEVASASDTPEEAVIDFGCEICHNWNHTVNITKQWWKNSENDWRDLNGKDLPCFIAILSVLRELMLEIFDPRYHSKMETDYYGYKLVFNKNCNFTPLSETQKEKWNSLHCTIRIFRNGAAHIREVHTMKPYLRNYRDPQDSTQDYYRYAPYPDLKKEALCKSKEYKYDESELQRIHELIRDTILEDVRSVNSNIPSGRIRYEFMHIERGPFINLLHEKLDILLKEAKAIAIPSID